MHTKTIIHSRTSGGVVVVVKWSTKFLMMWQNHSSVLFTERENKKTNTHTHTHTHTHIQECVCRTKSGEKKEEEINSNFAVFVICHFGEIPPFILSFLR